MELVDSNEMKRRILVAYTTNAGTTAEVAQAIGEELGKDGMQVDVRRLLWRQTRLVSPESVAETICVVGYPGATGRFSPLAGYSGVGSQLAHCTMIREPSDYRAIENAL
jgi:flavorubredoxin